MAIFKLKHLKMKKILLLLVMGVSMMYATSASAQGYLKLNPLNWAIGQFGLAYEGILNEKSSFQVGANFFNYRVFDLSGFGGSLQYRFYLTSDDAPKGLFVAPHVGINITTWKDDSGVLENESFTRLKLGAMIGYQWLFSDDKFTFELGIGPAYKLNIGDVGEQVDLGGNIGPIASLSLGYRLVE